jgi:hypothetical protein
VFDPLRRQSAAARLSSLSRLCVAFCDEAICRCSAASLHRAVLLLNAPLSLAPCHRLAPHSSASPRRRSRVVVRPSRRVTLSAGERVATIPRSQASPPANSCRAAAFFAAFRRTPCVRPSPNLAGATHTDPHTPGHTSHRRSRGRQAGEPQKRSRVESRLCQRKLLGGPVVACRPLRPVQAQLTQMFNRPNLGKEIRVAQ